MTPIGFSQTFTAEELRELSAKRTRRLVGRSALAALALAAASYTAAPHLPKLASAADVALTSMPMPR